MPAQLITSFNAGELSPYLDARSDLEKYASGCRRLENFVIMPYGGVYRRPGTEYLGSAKFGDKRCRLLGFNFSTTTRFVIEAGQFYFRFWSNGVQVLSGDEPLELETPYLESQLRELQFIQINDVMYFVHPLHAPRKLIRQSDDDWVFEEITWDWPALLDENTEAATIAVEPASAPNWATATAYVEGVHVKNGGKFYRCTVAHTSGTFSSDLASKWILLGSIIAGTQVKLTASSNVFEAGHVGSFWQIGNTRSTAFVEKTIAATGVSGTIAVLGAWEFNTYGTWTATLTIERSNDSGTTWETIRSYRSVNDFNAAATGREEKEALLRVNVTAYTSNTNGRAIITVQESKDYGIVKIVGVTGGLIANGEVVNDLIGPEATKFWSEGAWSDWQGFPRTVSLHEQRIYFGGTTRKPQSIWGSVINDFGNFRLSSNDDGGLFFTLSAQEANHIQWMLSQDELLIGTSGDEWTLGSGNADGALTPTSVKASRQSSYGSKYLRALNVNDVVLFIQRQGRKVRELVYSFEKDGWIAPDLTVLAEHVTRGEIVECAFQQQPDAIYWTITGDGQLVGMTYEREQNVVGWHRHTTGVRQDGSGESRDEFESIATVYGANGADEVWLSVRRTIDGEDVRYIERFRTDFREMFEEENKSQWWYLDCAKAETFESDTSEFEGLDHLEGRHVDVLANGAVAPGGTVEAGSITIQTAEGHVVAGLPFVSWLQPMKFDLQLQDGTSRGRLKRVHRMTAAVHKSLGGEFSDDEENWNWFYSRSLDGLMDDSPAVFTGDRDVYVAGTSEPGASVTIRQAQPLPLTLLALVARWEVYGN